MAAYDTTPHMLTNTKMIGLLVEWQIELEIVKLLHIM